MTAASAAAATETPVDIAAVAVEDVGFAISGKLEPVTEEIIADFYIRMEAVEIKDTEETAEEATEGIGTRAAADTEAAVAAVAEAAASVSTGRTTAHAPLATDVGFRMAMPAARAVAAVAVGRAAVAVAVVAADPRSATTGNAAAAHTVTNAASSIPVPAAPRMAAWKPARAATNFFNQLSSLSSFCRFPAPCSVHRPLYRRKEKVNKVQKSKAVR